MMLNPMVVPLTMVRHGIDGSVMDVAWNHIWYSVGFSLAVFLIGMTVFKRWESKVVKYL